MEWWVIFLLGMGAGWGVMLMAVIFLGAVAAADAKGQSRATMPAEERAELERREAAVAEREAYMDELEEAAENDGTGSFVTGYMMGKWL